jgi:salicylate hydroxylase
MDSSYFMMHVSGTPRSSCDTKIPRCQHVDLLEVLFRLASSAGARVNFGVTVESVEAARETPPETRKTNTGPASRTLRPTVRLRTGEVLHADVIIGADGRRSIVRRVVTDEDEEPETTSYGFSHYTGTVPMTEIRKYAPLKQLVDVGWPIWFGDRRTAIGTSSSFYPGNGPSFC